MLSAPNIMSMKPYTENATPTDATALSGCGSLPAQSVKEPNAQASLQRISSELYARLEKERHP